MTLSDNCDSRSCYLRYSRGHGTSDFIDMLLSWYIGDGDILFIVVNNAGGNGVGLAEHGKSSLNRSLRRCLVRLSSRMLIWVWSFQNWSKLVKRQP